MSQKDEYKAKIVRFLQKEAVSQENRVKEIIEKLRLNKKDIEEIFGNDPKAKSYYKKEYISAFSECKCSFIKQYFYEDSHEGKRKQRELDIIAYFEIADNEDIFFMLTFLGDIKRTDDYKWVFTTDMTTDEVEAENFDFPHLKFNEQVTLADLLLSDIISLYQDFKIPIATELIPFHPNGELIENGKKNRLRGFFEQVNNGIENYYFERIDYEPDSYGNRKVHHIIIPILITSSNYLYCQKLPPNNPEDLDEENMMIYLFSPSKPSLLNKWRIPILVVSEEKLEASLKKIIYIFKLRYWRFFENL